ncbi:hypothetical protein ACNOYE_34220 [Nannocystaceae bacterium ST9]
MTTLVPCRPKLRARLREVGTIITAIAMALVAAGVMVVVAGMVLVRSARSR